jgi:hypothetical protein
MEGTVRGVAERKTNRKKALELDSIQHDKCQVHVRYVRFSPGCKIRTSKRLWRKASCVGSEYQPPYDLPLLPPPSRIFLSKIEHVTR